MRKLICLVSLFITINLLGNNPPAFIDTIDNSSEVEMAAFTLGILQGGGSLVGVDLEFLLTKRFGFQVGAGLIGYGAGINYHLKPGVRSSYVSFQYWHQGIGEGFTQSVIGPTFVFRGKKWFTAQLGIGKALKEGPAWPDTMDQPPVMLMYSIGAYIPW